MNVIPPLTITDAILTSSSVAEPSATEVVWSATTAYTVGQVVILTSTHRKYECLVANTNFSPDVNTTGLTPKWLDVGPTNKWAMFDLLRNSATTNGNTITIVLTPGTTINSIAILKSNAATINITITSVSGGGEVYNNTLDMRNRRSTGWYSYYFAELTLRENIALFNLPSFYDSVLTITLYNEGVDVSCGGLVIGKYVNLGHTSYGGSSDTLNFSTIERDIFGNATLIQRRSVPKTTQVVVSKAANINSIRGIRDSLAATPAVWSGINSDYTNDYYDTLIILGFYKNFSISMPNSLYAKIDLELEEI